MNNRVLVISRFNENLDWTKLIKTWDKLIFNKGDNIEELNAIPLNNVGREAHTYLHYIVENYYNLPQYVGFLQGYPFPHFAGSYPDNIDNVINDRLKISDTKNVIWNIDK